MWHTTDSVEHQGLFERALLYAAENIDADLALYPYDGSDPLIGRRDSLAISASASDGFEGDVDRLRPQIDTAGRQVLFINLTFEVDHALLFRSDGTSTGADADAPAGLHHVLHEFIVNALEQPMPP